jgi:ribonuclease HII
MAHRATIHWGKSIDRDFSSGNVIVAGVDEVGRGCLAGPVYAAAVILDYNLLQKSPETELSLIRDSKTLSHIQRQKALKTIYEIKKEVHVGSATVLEIESLGISGATFLAMRRALEMCDLMLDQVLVDGNQLISELALPQTAIVGGDGKCFAIASASIVAKEARDHFMRAASAAYPDYGFDRHVGYGTQQHIEQIKKLGITALHRRTFAPISHML